jgi:hypothetical protein
LLHVRLCLGASMSALTTANNPNPPPLSPMCPGNSITRTTDAARTSSLRTAPAANGCGGLFAFLVNPLVNAIVGLPAAAGHNTAIVSGSFAQAPVKYVAHVLPKKPK